jgi:DNA-binding MarR family transcriptional regulator
VEIDGRRQALEFEAGFQQAYLRFHRRDGKRAEVSSASRGLMTHLGLSGPLTVGELSAHLDRAQSVVSELVSRLVGKGLLARERDPDNGRRTLVWLTDEGMAFLQRDRQVLSVELLEATMRRMAPADRDALLRGLRALVAADDAHTDEPLTEGDPS